MRLVGFVTVLVEGYIIFLLIVRENGRINNIYIQTTNNTANNTTLLFYFKRYERIFRW